VTNRQSIWLFSATMPHEVRAIAANYMTNPKELSTGNVHQTNTNIEHEYYLCRADDRFATLKRVVDANPGIYGLVFCRTKAETKEIAEQMIRDGYNSDALHGDLSQSDRDRVMQRFRERNLQLLVATDVAARGIDVSEITHVINYGLSDEIEVYTHRSGRTGRAGHKGVSIIIITSKFEERIRQIERKLKTTIPKKMIPTGFEVCERQLFHIIRGIHEQEVHDAEIEPYMERIYEELKDLSKEDLIKRLASVEFNRFLSYYRNAPDINVYPRGSSSNRTQQGLTMTRPDNTGQLQRLFVNVGEMDGVTKKDFIRVLSRNFGVPTGAIGHIDLNKAYMHFDLDAAYVAAVRRGLSEFTINGRHLRVDDASAPKERAGFKNDDRGESNKFKGSGKPKTGEKRRGKW
ncbi:MAG: DEAD/DEAH box helicase, partial [Saprospiraceae bacterium]